MEIPVSAETFERARQRALGFLADPRAGGLQMTLFNGWLPTAAGALFSVVALLYVLGMVRAIGRAFLRLFGLGREADAHEE